MKHLKETALLLVGVQIDHFGPFSPLREMIEEPHRIDEVKNRILNVVDQLSESPITMMNLPILFREGHPEITQEIGILAIIKNCGLFLDGTAGGCIIPELGIWDDRTITLPGRTGFNAFVDTGLHAHLTERHIKRLVLVGSCTAVCIDSTARSGYELGYDVVVLEDCTISRTADEQEMYCRSIFPLYASVMNSHQLISSIGPGATSPYISLAG